MFSTLSLPYLIEEGIRCAMELEDVDNIIASYGQQRIFELYNAYKNADCQK
jgi:hypothetical protein